MMKKLIFVLAIPCLILTSCSSIKEAEHNISTDLKNNADSLGFHLVKGARVSLTADESRQNLQMLIDSLLTHAGQTSNYQLRGIRDSLLNDYIYQWVSKTAANAVQNMNSNFLDDKTTERLKHEITKIVANIGPSLLNDSVLTKISALRDTLLGSQTNMMVKAIVDSALATIIIKLNTGINPAVKENISFVQKNAIWLLFIVGIIVLVIIWFVWIQKEKYLKLSKLLIYQISEVQEKSIKENLKNNIFKNAKQIGIEDGLRKLLYKNGLLHNSIS